MITKVSKYTINGKYSDHLLIGKYFLDEYQLIKLIISLSVADMSDKQSLLVTHIELTRQI
jgi:hypothetical protein